MATACASFAARLATMSVMMMIVRVLIRSQFALAIVTIVVVLVCCLDGRRRPISVDRFGRRSRGVRRLELAQIAPHRVRVLAVRIVLGLDLQDLEAQRVCIEVQSGPIALTHVQRYIFGVEALHHGTRCLIHKFLCQTKTTIRAFDSERRDVAVLAVRVRLLHLGQDIAHNVPFVVLCNVA